MVNPFRPGPSRLYNKEKLEEQYRKATEMDVFLPSEEWGYCIGYSLAVHDNWLRELDREERR